MKKLKEDTKKEFSVIVIVAILLLILQGFCQGFRILFIILLVGSMFITAIWLFCFVIMLLLTRSLKEAWDTLNPGKMLIECFFDNSEESEGNDD